MYTKITVRINWKKNFLIKSIQLIFSFLVTICFMVYFSCVIYNFPLPHKFSGNYLFNPYEDTSPNWQKANFHAHAIAWSGITNGRQKATEILKLYHQKGYDYACISNYENIAKEDNQPGSVNAYEHGYNTSKVHQLVIMPQRVRYTDFPFYQFTSAKQFTINKLSAQARAVALPHPLMRNGYKDAELQKISGYNLIEVLNHSCNSSHKWDVALSAGKPAWIIGDDDTHDMRNSSQTFTNWTMIDCHNQNKDSLINNLIEGNAYGVTGKHAFNDNKLVYVKVERMHILISLQNSADSIQFIGQNGIKRVTFFNTSKGDYEFLYSDTYIRTVIYNKASTIYLNPFIRYNGVTRPQNFLTAVINKSETILYRISLATCWMISVLCLNFHTLKHVFESQFSSKRQTRKKFITLL